MIVRRHAPHPQPAGIVKHYRSRTAMDDYRVITGLRAGVVVIPSRGAYRTVLGGRCRDEHVSDQGR